MKRETGQPLYEVLGILLLVLLIGWFYSSVIWGGKIFVFVDASRFFYPLWKWGAGVWSAGRIPFWNPDAQFGTPYFADPQMACAYPPVPLFYGLLDPDNAFAWLIILHHFWALWGFWRFARREGMGWGAALFGTLAFGFSLHVVCSSWTPVGLFTISWIPWTVQAALSLYRGKKGATLALSLCAALQLSAGYPVLVYLTALTLGSGLILWTFWENKPGQWNWLKGAAVAGLLAVIYNLVWLLPFAEFFRFSNYQGGGDHLQPLGWKDLATLLNPFFQGHPLEPSYTGPHYWISTYYMGLPLLVLILMGIFQGSYPLMALMGFGLVGVLSMGETLGLGGWLKGLIPGYSLVIRSGFWLGIFIFCAAWLGALSVDRQGAKEEPGTKDLFLWVFTLLGVFGVSYLLGAPQEPVYFLVAAFLMMASAPLSPLKLHWRQTAWVLALGASLIPIAVSVNILLDRSYYDQKPALVSKMPEQGRVFFTPSYMKNAFRLQGADYRDAYGKAKERLYPNWPLAEGLEEIPLYNTFQLSTARPFTREAFGYSEAHTKAILDYLDVRYLLGVSRLKGLKTISPMGQGEWAYENPLANSKWFSVREAKLASGSIDEDFKRAAHESWLYDSICTVENPSLTGAYSSRPVRVITSYCQGVELEAPGKGRALLVSSEAAYPGWKAFVDGKEKTVLRVNHVFRGVVLEEGECQVVMAFEPETLRLGFFMALLTCGIWVVWLGVLLV